MRHVNYTGFRSSHTLSIAPLDLISIEHLKLDSDLIEYAIVIYLYHVVDVVKFFVVYYILLTFHSQQYIPGIRDDGLLCKM